MRRLLAAPALLPFAIFWSTMDRAIPTPLVQVVADDLHTTVVAASTAITAWAIAYSVFQLVWGPLQTRIGRVRVMTLAFAIGSAANILAAFAPEIVTFIILRTISGGAYAGVFAAVLVYFGDTLPLARRHGAMSNLASATALGLAIGNLGAGAIASWTSWRWIFGVFGAVAVLVTIAIARLPEPEHGHVERVIPQLRSVGRNGWAWLIYVMTVLEGALLIGIYNFLPVALQQHGSSVFVSGLVTAMYGIAVVVFSQLLKLFVHRVPAWSLFALAGALATAAFAVLVTAVDPLTVVVGAGLMGMAWAFGHTTLQTWITDVVVDARALGMTFFSISLMLGGAIGAAFGQAAAGFGAWSWLFAAAIAGSAGFGAATGIGRARYRERETASSVAES